jgi:hypothetical protein
MARKTQFVEQGFLSAVTLPNFEGGRYTVVSHDEAIKNMKNTFSKFGYHVRNEVYKSAEGGNIATGSFTLNHGDSEMGLMVAFINSYNKKTSFKYAMGASVFVCDNGMIAGDKFNYKRKHMGDVDVEAFLTFDKEMEKAVDEFKELVDLRENLKKVDVSHIEMAELCGRMFITQDILNPRQMSDLKAEINKPTYDYGGNNNTAWEFYNHLTHVAKRAHPTDYFKHHRDITDFITSEFEDRFIRQSIEDINFEMMEDSFENHLIYS